MSPKLRLRLIQCDDGSRRVEKAGDKERHQAKAGAAFYATCMVCQQNIGHEPFDEVKPRSATSSQMAHRDCALNPATHTKKIQDGRTM